MGFLHPLAQHRAVGRIQPADTFPGLLERILAGGEIAAAFGVVGQGRAIDGEMKLFIEGGEEFRGRVPDVALVLELDRLALAQPLPVSGLALGVRAVDFGASHGSK